MATTTKFIWDGQNYLAEANGTDTLDVIYTNEPEQFGNLISTRISSTTAYHHFDAIGSTGQMTNAFGRMTDTVQYDSSGNVTVRSGATATACLWIGERGYYSDRESGAIYIRARTYNPDSSRWTAVDPALFADGANRFVYVGNSAVTFVDPSGQIKVIGLTSKTSREILNPKCGTEVSAKWNFVVDYTDPKTGKVGAPCDGYVVQKVTVNCRIKPCVPQVKDQTFVYYEAWPVAAGGGIEDPKQKKGGVIDSSGATPTLNLCGKVTHTGEIRFYCKTGDNGTGDLTKATGWKNGGSPQYGDKTFCPTTPLDLLSFDGGMGDRGPAPPFWKKAESSVTDAKQRCFRLQYTCCPGKTDKITINFDPAQS